MKISLFLLFSVISTGCLSLNHNRKDKYYNLKVSINNKELLKNIKEIKDFKVTLICFKGGDTKNTQILEATNGITETMEFPAIGLKENDKCHLEITSNAYINDANYIWLAWSSTGPIANLFYRSTISPIILDGTQKQLKLQVYKVYRKKSEDEFNAQIVIDLKDLQKANILDIDGAMATLKCKDDISYVANAFEMIKNQLTKRLITFEIPSSNIWHEKCYQIIATLPDIAEFQSDILNFTFSPEKPGVTIKFKEEVPLSLKEENMGLIDCLETNIDKKCISLSFPKDNNYWFAKVSDNNKDYILTNGFKLDETTKDISIDQINEKIKTNKYLLIPWDQKLLNKLINDEFNPDNLNTLIKGKELKDQSNINISYFKEVYLHGFKPIPEKELNAMENPRWFAYVKAINTYELQDFIVTGTNKYFMSQTMPKGKKYFSWDNIDDTNIQYDIYSLKGYDDKCNNSLDFYINSLSQKTDSQLEIDDKNLNNCKISSKLLKKFDTTWLRVNIFYLWNWHKFIF